MTSSPHQAPRLVAYLECGGSIPQGVSAGPRRARRRARRARPMTTPGVMPPSTCPHCGAAQTCCAQGRTRGAVGHGSPASVKVAGAAPAHDLRTSSADRGRRGAAQHAARTPLRTRRSDMRSGPPWRLRRSAPGPRYRRCGSAGRGARECLWARGYSLRPRAPDHFCFRSSIPPSPSATASDPGTVRLVGAQASAGTAIAC